MYHLFTALDRRFVLDVGSGALHALDSLAYAVLAARQQGLDEVAIQASLEPQYDPEDIALCCAELAALRKDGALDAPDDYPELAGGSPSVVKAMCLHAAHDCNLRCRYCFADTGDFHMQNRGLLPLETGKKALDWLVAHSGNRHALEVDFFGGEPLMNFPVVQALVAYGRSLEQRHNKRFAFTITTNAVGLDDENIDFINREMDNVVLSLDGRPQVHDRMRPTPGGGGSYAIAQPKAKALVDRRGEKQYFVRGTFSALNLDFAQDVLWLREAGFAKLSVEPVIADPEAPYAIRPEMLPAVFAEYDRLAALYQARRKEDPDFTFFHFTVDLAGGPCLKKRLTGCGAGNEYVAVTPEGDLYPCHQFVGREGFRMGSVLDDSFDRDMQARFARNDVLHKPACRACWAKYFCSGGCAANAHAFSGTIETPSDLECQMQRKRLELALALYADG